MSTDNKNLILQIVIDEANKEVRVPHQDSRFTGKTTREGSFMLSDVNCPEIRNHSLYLRGNRDAERGTITNLDPALLDVLPLLMKKAAGGTKSLIDVDSYPHSVVLSGFKKHLLELKDTIPVTVGVGKSTDKEIFVEDKEELQTILVLTDEDSQPLYERILNSAIFYQDKYPVILSIEGNLKTFSLYEDKDYDN